VPFYMGACWKMVVVHGGKEEENEDKTACDDHVTC
jgi:hypothetical protein